MGFTVLKNNSSSSQLGILFIILSFVYIIAYIDTNNLIYINGLSIKNLDITKTTMSRHCLLIEESSKNITSMYYRDVTAIRNSSYPFISGDTFRALADYLFDETRKDNLESVKYGDIVFVKGDLFRQFFSGPYQSINNPFVLITHNTDNYAPDQHRSRLKDEKLIAWYASNPDVRDHPKLFPIPIGLANIRWPSGNLRQLMYAFENYRTPWANRTTLLYVNFSPDTNPKERTVALSQVANFKNIEIIKEKVSFDTYLQQLGNAKFVLSPPGNGLDCHRTWEALLMGAAPVTRSSGLDVLFNKIPAVIVSNWSYLTEDLLLSQRFSSYGDLMPNALYARYWRERLQKHRVR
jgi:hypothetical protein